MAASLPIGSMQAALYDALVSAPEMAPWSSRITDNRVMQPPYVQLGLDWQFADASTKDVVLREGSVTIYATVSAHEGGTMALADLMDAIVQVVEQAVFVIAPWQWEVSVLRTASTTDGVNPYTGESERVAALAFGFIVYEVA